MIDMTMNRSLTTVLFYAGILRFAAGINQDAVREVDGPGMAQRQPDEPDDLKGLRRLDPEVITAVHRKYFDKLFRYARFRLDDDKLAEDAAGEAFIRLLEALHAGKGPRASVGGWLMRTVSNLVNDFYRLHYARPTEELSERMPADNPGPAALTEALDEQHLLYKALKGLTSDQQQVLALRFGSGYSLAETAEVMDKNANAIKALQFRAIGALRRAMEHYDE